MGEVIILPTVLVTLCVAILETKPTARSAGEHSAACNNSTCAALRHKHSSPTHTRPHQSINNKTTCVNSQKYSMSVPTARGTNPDCSPTMHSGHGSGPRSGPREYSRPRGRFVPGGGTSDGSRLRRPPKRRYPISVTTGVVNWLEVCGGGVHLLSLCVAVERSQK